MLGRMRVLVLLGSKVYSGVGVGVGDFVVEG